MPSSRIPSLDGLRALSILMVVFGHFAYTPDFPVQRTVLSDEYAHYGVRIFFVISGFLITSLLMRERERTGAISLKNFYIRRAYRILPVAYVYLIVIALVFHDSLTYEQLAVVFTYLSSYVAHLPWELSHLWSLSIEEQFYLVWPIAMLWSTTSARRFAFAAVVIAPVFRIAMNREGFSPAATYFFPAVVDSIAAGCLLALYQPRLEAYRAFFTWRGFPIIWAFTLGIPVLRRYCDAFLIWPLPSLVHIFALTIFNIGIVLCVQNAITVRPRILNHPIAVWIGTLSYSLYLWQMPFTNPDVPSWVATFPQNLVLAFLAAIASFYGIERPVLRMRERRTTRSSPPTGMPVVFKGAAHPIRHG